MGLRVELRLQNVRSDGWWMVDDGWSLGAAPWSWLYRIKQCNNLWLLDVIVLYCIVLYCIVLYCIVLCFMVLSSFFSSSSSSSSSSSPLVFLQPK